MRGPYTQNDVFASSLRKTGAVPHQRSVGSVAAHANTDTRQAASSLSEGGTAIGGNAAVYKAVGCACFGAFLFGYHLGIVNGPLTQIATDLNFAGDVTLQGLVVSISLAGAAVGSLAGSGLADSLGRVKSFAVDAVPLLAGAALSATAGGAAAMLSGRFLVGLGIGLSSALVPLYISEVAPTSVRGTLGSINQLMICFGILAALVVNVLLPVDAWRSMFWLATVPAVLLALGILSCPESPAYLLAKGQKSAAEAAAESLWGKGFRKELYGNEGDGGESAMEAVGKMEIGKMEVDSGATGRLEVGSKTDGPRAANVSWGEMFSGTNGRLVGIACALFVVQQLSGINAIVYFSSSVFQNAGIASGALASAAVGVVNVAGTFLAASLMDKRGRKQLLSVSLAGQGVAMITMATVFATPALQGLSAPVALIGTLLYVLFFALGTGPVPGLLCAELLPVSIRGRGVSMALAVHWVCNFALGQLFLQAVGAVGVSGVYCFFSAICALGVTFVSTQLVETKGRSPEEIMKLMTK